VARGEVGLDGVVLAHLEEHVLQTRDRHPVARGAQLLQARVQRREEGAEAGDCVEGQRVERLLLCPVLLDVDRLRHVLVHEGSQRGQLLAAEGVSLVEDELVACPVGGLEELRGAHALHLPQRHDAHPVPQHVRLVHVVRGQQHRAPLAQRGQQVPQLPPGQRVHACSRLVQNHELGPAADRDGHGQLAALPARELVAQVVQALVQVEERGQLGALPVRVIVRGALELREEQDVLAHGEALEEHVVLRTDAQRPAHGLHLGQDVGPVHLRAVVSHGEVGGDEAGEHGDAGGLARAVVPQQGEYLVLVHAEGQVVHGHLRAEGLAQLVHHHRGRAQQLLVGGLGGGARRDDAILLCLSGGQGSRLG